MSKYEYKTIEIEIQNSLIFGSRDIEASEVEKALNEYSEEGWEYISPIQKVTNGYTDQIILVFRKEKEI